MISRYFRPRGRHWDPAWDLIIDEQTIGFQGRHKDKLHIAFKDSGDGFQADDVCDCGYTYSFIYSNYDIPDSKHYLCATSERVIWLLKRLKIECNHAYMDSLYNNVKLYRAAYAEKKLLYGVARTHGQGVAEAIIQQEVKSKKKQDEVRGEVKLAVMKGDATCPDVLACSLYDTKPVHIISTVADNIKWTPINKKFYIKIEKKSVDMTFHCLNVIHIFTFGMVSVDEGDQLRMQYRPDHWMRNRKSWWSIFLWGLG